MTTVDAIKERYGLTDEEARRFALLVLFRQAGTGSRFPTDGSPTLILDFIGGNVPNGSTLGLDFTGQTYTAFSADPSAPQGFANFWAWS